MKAQNRTMQRKQAKDKSKQATHHVSPINHFAVSDKSTDALFNEIQNVIEGKSPLEAGRALVGALRIVLRKKPFKTTAPQRESIEELLMGYIQKGTVLHVERHDGSTFHLERIGGN